MRDVSDGELIQQLQAGSLDALGELYDRHQKMVYRTALAITGDEDTAGDLLQDSFLRLHRFAARVDHTRPIEPWLYRTTTNLAYTFVKRNNRWFQPLEDIAEWLAAGKKQSPSVQTEKGEEWAYVRKAILALPIQQRVVVVLYYINDLSLLEISGIVNVPVGTVKSRLFYGRQALRRSLSTDETVKLREVQYEFT